MSKIEFDGTIKWHLNLFSSFNYQYFYVVLKTLFFEHNLFEMCIDAETTNEVLCACAKIVSEESGLPLDTDYLELKYYFGVGEDNSRSIIIEYEFPFPIETECKFAALVKDTNGKDVFNQGDLQAVAEFAVSKAESEMKREMEEQMKDNDNKNREDDDNRAKKTMNKDLYQKSR